MKPYGTQWKLLKWIESLLPGREKRIRVNGDISMSKPRVSEMPQGSVLGPLLFFLYIRALPISVSFNILIYADETKHLKQVGSRDDGLQLQKDIDAPNRWSENGFLP